jgi:CRISPR system Cascade subunit CasD
VTVLVIRLDAPLVSFGAPAIDHNGVVQPFPALSMLTGLIANALGWDHRDVEKLQGLQERVRYAARIDRQGELLIDYQTVDLTSDWMVTEKAGWTTRGRVIKRAGASSNETHQRYRHFRADSLHTVAVTLLGHEMPSCENVAEAFHHPARPLFIGRKCCIPAAPILLDTVEGQSLVGVLGSVPRTRRTDSGPLPAFWWSDDDETGAVGDSRIFAVTDERDWEDRVHVGRRLMRQGHVDPPETRHV